MRGNVPAYELKRLPTLEATLQLISDAGGEYRPFAGGTDLMVLFEAGHLKHSKFVSLWHLNELRGIETTSDHLTMGALTTYTDLRRHPVVQAEFGLLIRAASETGAIAIQNRGTLGGNIANASPAADTPPALLVYEAEIELLSKAGARWVPYFGFHQGYKKIALRTDELISRIRVPRPRTAEARGWHAYYRKVGTRKAQAISKVCFTGVLAHRAGLISEVRIALGSVAPIPTRIPRTEAILRGKQLDATLISQAQAELLKEIVPIDDIRSTSRYRLRIAANLLEDFLHEATGIAGN